MMKFKKISNPRWADPDKIRIKVDALVDSPEEHFKKSIEVVLCSDDIEPHIIDLWKKVNDGEFGDIKAFRANALYKEELQTELDQRMRDNKDVVDTLSFALEAGLATEQEKKELRARKIYAVQLLRVPQQKNYPNRIEWPTLEIV